MDNLPREHGLIVSWLLTVLAGVLLSSQFRPYGIVLTLLLIPTLFVYDRLIVGGIAFAGLVFILSSPDSFRVPVGFLSANQYFGLLTTVLASAPSPDSGIVSSA
jgi:hypothetical protein